MKSHARHILQPDRRLEFRRQAILLQIGVVFYNVVECLIALIVGHHIGSIALFGFGVDGALEIASSTAVLLYLKRDGWSEGSPWESRVARFVGLTLIVLALYIFNDSMFRLIYRVKPDESYLGLFLAAASLIVMTRVARVEHVLARNLNSPALRAESRETLVCAWLSAALLVSLSANLLFGLWWVDPAVGLLMATLIGREGIVAFSSRELVHDHAASEALAFLPRRIRKFVHRLDLLGLLSLESETLEADVQQSPAGARRDGPLD